MFQFSLGFWTQFHFNPYSPLFYLFFYFFNLLIKYNRVQNTNNQNETPQNIKTIKKINFPRQNPRLLWFFFFLFGLVIVGRWCLFFE
jgi:hypothetical protein